MCVIRSFNILLILESILGIQNVLILLGKPKNEKFQNSNKSQVTIPIYFQNQNNTTEALGLQSQSLYQISCYF
jgi:hypothetical protein